MPSRSILFLGLDFVIRCCPTPGDAGRINLLWEVLFVVSVQVVLSFDYKYN